MKSKSRKNNRRGVLILPIPAFLILLNACSASEETDINDPVTEANAIGSFPAKGNNIQNIMEDFSFKHGRWEVQSSANQIHLATPDPYDLNGATTQTGKEYVCVSQQLAMAPAKQLFAGPSSGHCTLTSHMMQKGILHGQMQCTSPRSHQTAIIDIDGTYTEIDYDINLTMTALTKAGEIRVSAKNSGRWAGSCA